MDTYLTTKQAAEMLKITRGYLRKMNMRRAIPYYNPTGRKCLYKEADITAYIQQGKVSSYEELANKAILY